MQAISRAYKRRGADSECTLALMSVYAYGVAARVRSIAFSNDGTCEVLTTMDVTLCNGRDVTAGKRPQFQREACTLPSLWHTWHMLACWTVWKNRPYPR